MATCILAIISLVVCMSLVGGTTVDYMMKLHTYLLEDYNKNIRPVNDHLKAVNVNTTFRFVSLQDLDDLSGVVKFLSYTSLMWRDVRLNWNRSEFGEISKVSLRAEDVWKPELVMLNSPDQRYLPGNNARFVTFNDRGVARLTSVDLLHTTCSVDVTNYPFDTQMCEIVIVPWGYTVKEVLFTKFVDDTYRDKDNTEAIPSFIDNSAWKTDSVKVFIQTNDYYSSLIIELSFTRRHLYATANLIIPVFVLALLNMWVFWLPPESGERTSYSITVFLSFAVYMSILSDNMPKGSEPLALVNYEMFILMLYSSSILCCTIISLRMYNNINKKEVPNYLVAKVRLIKCTRRGNITSKNVIEPINEDDRKIDGPLSHINLHRIASRPNLKKADIIWRMSRLTKVVEGQEPELEVTWTDVGDVFDKTACLFHFVWWIIQVTIHFVIILK